MELIKMEPSYYYQNGPHQNGTLLLLSKGILIKMELIIKRNTHIIIKMDLIKMEHSYYYQNGTLILLSKGILIKMELIIKRNTHIIIKMEHSY